MQSRANPSQLAERYAARPVAMSAATYLRQHLATLTERNPRYSLRAFAKSMGLSPGGLSQILNGNRKLSIDRALVIARKLKLSDTETERLLWLAQLDGANVELRAKLLEQSGTAATYQDLSVSQFQVVSDWHGLAILEYVTEPGRNTQPKAIAKYFALPLPTVLVTLDRLESLELIEKTESNQYGRAAERLRISSSSPKEAIRNYYHSILRLADASIDEQTPQEKVVAAEVINFDPSQIDQVRTLVDEFIDKLYKIQKPGKPQNEVYQLFVDFFRLKAKPGVNPK